MAEPRRKSKYRGVSWETRKGKWKARIKFGEQTYHFLYSDDELDCAWTADFVRYMLFGLDPSKWPGKALKPNFAPCRYEGVFRPSIVRVLLMLGIVEPNEMIKRLVQYDRIARFLRPNEGTPIATGETTGSLPSAP